MLRLSSLLACIVPRSRLCIYRLTMLALIIALALIPDLDTTIPLLGVTLSMWALLCYERHRAWRDQHAAEIQAIYDEAAHEVQVLRWALHARRKSNT